jgi:hypothetical protein
VHVNVQFERTAIESNASGEIILKMNLNRSYLWLRVHQLEPAHEYLLLADGTERARFTTDPSGEGVLWMRYPVSNGRPELDFDPRGKRISVSDGGAERLAAVVSGPGEPFSAVVEETADIPPTDPNEVGTVTGRYRTLPVGCRVWNVALQDVASGTYQVVVDGSTVGEIEADGGGKATLRFYTVSAWGVCLEFMNDSAEGPGAGNRVLAPLDFEPRGAQVQVIGGGEVVFAGPMRAEVALPQAALCPEVDIAVPLQSAYWFGAGDASMSSKDEVCNHEFRVVARAVPAANYELWVAGSKVGIVPVRNWEDESRGEVRFDSEPDEPDELPLDFDPRGQLVEVRRPIGIPPVLYLGADFPTE